MNTTVKLDEITVNGITYVRADAVNTTCPVNSEGLKYCIVRTYSAGVFAGYVKSRNGMEVEMVAARRMYYWEGAASLSELAVKGTGKPDKCKFPVAVNVLLTQVVEVLECTEVARKSIEGVKTWTAQ